MAYNSTCDDSDYYAILGVPYTADFKTIRKAYLKLSLQYHPDKNTNNPEQAQEAFVRIGRAYQTLSDPTQRRIYDQTYRSGSSSSSNNNRYRPSTTSSPPPQYTKQSSFTKDFYESSQCDSNYNHYSANSNNNAGNNSSNSQQYQQQQQYETYRAYFDNTMADLSDDEMNEILGAAAMFSSIIGGIIGAKLLGGGGSSSVKGGIGGGSTSSANPALSAIGSAIGSAIASQAATTILKNSHAQAKQRALNADPSRRQREHLRDHPSSPTHSSKSASSSAAASASYTHTEQTTQSDLPQNNNNWKDIVDNVMNGPIAKEAGKVVQQVVNDFINGSGNHKSKKSQQQ